MRILSLVVGLAVLLAAWPGVAFADSTENPDPPVALRKGDVFVAPEDGAFITDSRAQVMSNAFKRTIEERDGFKAKLEEKPAAISPKTVIIVGGIGLGVGAVVGVIIGILAHK